VFVLPRVPLAMIWWFAASHALARGQVRDLKTQARVFQNNRCSACQAPLDLPAVHFLCMHSFHQARVSHFESYAIAERPATQ
jgi:hypothetical protein